MGHASTGIATALCFKVSQAVMLSFLPVDSEHEEMYNSLSKHHTVHAVLIYPGHTISLPQFVVVP